jgi:hypothetical protein
VLEDTALGRVLRRLDGGVIAPALTAAIRRLPAPQESSPGQPCHAPRGKSRRFTISDEDLRCGDVLCTKCRAQWVGEAFSDSGHKSSPAAGYCGFDKELDAQTSSGRPSAVKVGDHRGRRPVSSGIRGIGSHGCPRYAHIAARTSCPCEWYSDRAAQIPAFGTTDHTDDAKNPDDPKDPGDPKNPGDPKDIDPRDMRSVQSLAQTQPKGSGTRPN